MGARLDLHASKKLQLKAGVGGSTSRDEPFPSNHFLSVTVHKLTLQNSQSL
jgi:hypothetical protein